ncbi:MAG: alpha-2-macroglobulin [Kofleriaceae bacterium]
MIRHVRTTALIGVAGALVAVSSCGGGGPRDLHVMSFSPQGPIDKTEPLEIRFDKPVIDAAMVGTPVSPGTVTIGPEVAWKGFWQDRQTLLIEPTTDLAPSTRYRVSLAGELGNRTSGFGFSFVHRPLVVEGVWGVDANALSPDSGLPLSFNQPVIPSEVAAHCKLRSATGDIALASTGSDPATHVSVRPASTLIAGASYTIICSELTGAGGNAALSTPYSLAVRARPTLSITNVSPSGRDVAADQVAITITFSTPMSLDTVRDAVTSKPTIPGLDRGELSRDGTEYKVTADLDAETDYQLTIAPLTDTFGQKLAKPTVQKFRTGDASPRLSMERGIFALEASAAGYPLWSRNVGKFSVECAAIPKDKLVQVLTTDMNYDPWGGNDDDQPIDWKALKLTAKTTRFTTPGTNKWSLNVLPLGTLCTSMQPTTRGVFLAEASSNEIVTDPTRGWLTPRRNRVLANVTDLGVLIKTGTASGLVWVTSLATGAPIEGAKVSVYTPQGKQVWTDVTSKDGIVRIPGSALLKHQKPVEDLEEEYDWDSYRSQRLIAIVEKAGDLAVVDGNWANGIQIWNFGLPEDRRGGATKIRGFIQSDRGLYRPGEKVHFKGIAREIAQGAPPRLPTKRSVAIEVQDSRGQTVLTTKTKLSSFGGFAFDFALGADAVLGDYHVRATVAEQVFRERFSVEEFRPATFELKLTHRNPHPRPGDRLAFDLDASYLFGAPVDAANVEWSLRKRTHAVRFAGYDEFTFSADPYRWWWSEDQDYGEFLSDGSGVTNARGHLQIAARDNATSFNGPVDYILSTNLTDRSDQTLSKSIVVTAHKTAFYLGMHANEFVQAVGMPFGVNLVALKPDGTRVTTTAKLTFTKTVRTCSWSEVGSRSYERCDTSDKPVLSRDVTIAAGGSHTERIYPTEPGDYVVKIEAKDDRGNSVVAASQIWVIGKGEAFWSGDEGGRMTLVASKPSYRPGDTARLVAQANLVKPTALITIERDGIIDARVQKLASASQGVELTIVDSWAPNVFAGVTLVAGRHGAGDRNRPMFKMGIVELKVSSAHKQLDVGISLDRAQVRPGEQVTGKIKVTHRGAPVAAEVSLSAADEGVLQLIAYQTPNPMTTFYASFGLGVDAGTNWNRIARLADPEAGDPDEGGDSGSSGDGQRVRSRFVSSAYWAPMLVTDERGEIAFSFTAPDNLTAFRLMAVAADAGDRFGAGELRLTVNKPLMAAPALPRFLRSDDTASVGVVIHNRTDRAGTATVTATANGVSLDRTKASVDVPANGSTRVRFTAKTSNNAAATFGFAVAMNGETDAVRVTIPIDRPRVIDHRVLVEQRLDGGAVWEGNIAAASDVIRAESRLEVTIDRTGLGDLAPGLRSLVEYPYGCLEQTMSRFIPLVAAKDLARTLDDPSLQGTKANQFIRAGTQKVIRHQQGDGQFSLWPQSQTYPHLTAYALWGLTVAEQAGEKVPAEVFDNGIRALSSWANATGTLKANGDGATLAMTAYVMAMRGKPDAGLNARLFALRAGLPKWGQAFLLRALHRANADPAQIAELEQLIASNIAVTNGRALVHESIPGHEYEMYMTSDVRATAMTLAALLEVDPKSPLIDPLAIGLKAARSKVGTWVSTQETLWSLIALADYARRGSSGETVATVWVGGNQVFKKRLTGAEVATARVPLTSASDRVKIVVNRPANVAARVIEARVDPGAAISNGFTIARAYYKTSGVEAASFKAGELVTVKLSIEAAASRRWIAIVDPLPAGLEIVNPKLAGAPSPSGGSPWTYVPYDHQDLRDDRVQWFADDLRAGRYELSYQARATIDGNFSAMPATIEAMYEPSVRGRTATAKIVVTK